MVKNVCLSVDVSGFIASCLQIYLLPNKQEDRCVRVDCVSLRFLHAHAIRSRLSCLRWIFVNFLTLTCVASVAGDGGEMRLKS